MADDEATTRLLLQRIIRNWGYEVVVAADGAAAWDLLRAPDGPSVAVLDWMMPSRDGIDLCQQLRTDDVGRYVYTILVTHRYEATDLKDAFERGADDLLRKPVDPDELRSRLAVATRVANYERTLQRYANKMESLAEARAQQLVHADRMATLGTLSAGVAHEINNPTTFIAGNTQTLQRFWNDIQVALVRPHGEWDEDLHEKIDFIIQEMPQALREIHEGTKRITKIVRELKSYAHRGRRSQELCSVLTCAKNAINLCRHVIQKSSTIVNMDIPEDLPRVHADVQQIEQVIVNLLVNAMDAMRAGSIASGHGPSINISACILAAETNHAATSTAISPARVQLCVQDNGPGITPDMIDRIWDPFFTTKPAGQGTGLGLAICKKIALDHGGDLHAHNGDHGGACFHLLLPAVTQDANDDLRSAIPSIGVAPIHS
ncbi:MAG: sensor histidine kinase [Polyangiales bacterium]